MEWDQLRLDGGADVHGSIAPAPSSSARDEIVRLRADGLGFEAIARSLNARHVPTPSGRGQWWPASARRHVDRDGWAAYMRAYRSAHAYR